MCPGSTHDCDCGLWQVVDSGNKPLLIGVVRKLENTTVKTLLLAICFKCPWVKSYRTQAQHSRQFQALSHLRGAPHVSLCPHLECLPSPQWNEEPTYVLETNQFHSPGPGPRLVCQPSPVYQTHDPRLLLRHGDMPLPFGTLSIH